jgi:mono/diheme cytochrome c family protein
MKKLGKILLWTVIALVVLLVPGISLTIGWRPFIGPKSRPLTSRHFEATPERLERGRYLFAGLTGCAACHSEHDLTQHGIPILPGAEGAGEVMPFDGLPGLIVAPNITPDPQTGAGNWTDDQIARAIREGIGHDGRALFPMMPYDVFKKMSDEDLASIVVYIRSLPPVHRELQKTEIIFPVKYLIRAAPQPVTGPVPSPDPADRLKYGEYLVNMGGCSFCHSPQVRGQVVSGMRFAGGNLMKGGWGQAATANLTPDSSGIGYYDEALFLQAMRTGYVKARKLSSIMPFGEYKNLKDDDLKMMFAYLRTVKPVKHRVDNSLPTYCKLCRQTHGAGDQN